MGWMSDLFDPKPDITSQNSTSTNTSQSGPENWMRTAGHTLYSQAAKSLPTSFKPYGGARVAGYGSGYNLGKADLAGMKRDSASWFNQNRGKLDQLWGANAGAMHKTAKDYMNPYVQGVLDPQLRGIEEDRKRQGLEDDRSATMAGAFGDPRAGLRKGVTNGKYATLKNDATQKGYHDAYEAGRAEHESEYARLMALPGMYSGIEAQRFGQQGAITEGDTKFGLADQALAQKKLDVKYDNYQKKMAYRTNRADTLMKLLGEVPHNQQASANTVASGWGSQPAPQIGWQLAGQALGGYMGGKFGGGGGGSAGSMW